MSRRSNKFVLKDPLLHKMASATLTVVSNSKWRHCHSMYTSQISLFSIRHVGAYAVAVATIISMDHFWRLIVMYRFIQVDYYLRPYITGHERPDKNRRSGAQIVKVYKQLTEHDALALTKMPENTEALMRWNASLRNIASLVRNHTSGDIRRQCVLFL